MARKPGAKNKSQLKPRKHVTCTCGLRIRCNDQEKHDAGWHHMNRK